MLAAATAVRTTLLSKKINLIKVGYFNVELFYYRKTPEFYPLLWGL